MRGILAHLAIVLAVGIAPAVASGIALADAPHDLLVKARTALKEGKAAEAYKLLAPHEPSLSGNAEYDYLFGIAALDAHHPDVAVFALERAVSELPGEAYVHADLARAYAALGELDATRQQIALAQQSKPPPEVAALLDRYLESLGRSGAAPGTTVAGYVQFGAGYDSNANSATGTRNMAIPAFGGYAFTLSDSSVKTGSHAREIDAVVAVQHVFSATTLGLLRIGAAKRYYSQASQLDTYNADLTAGLARSAGAHRFSLAVQAATLGLDGNDYRRTRDLLWQWQYHVGPRTQFGAFVQDGRITYPSAPLREARRFVTGISASRVLSAPAASLVYASGYAGSEHPTHSGYPFLGHDLYGIRIGSQVTISPGWTLVMGLGVEHRSYGGEDPLFLTPRRDRQTDGLIDVGYAVGRGWSLHTTLSGVDNASNLALNRFTRGAVQISVRKEF